MTAAIAALAVALGIAVVMLVRARHERARALAVVAASGGDLEAAVARRLRDTAPRSELSEARAWRDALMAAMPSPVLVFGADGRLVRANALARERRAPCSTSMRQPELAPRSRGARRTHPRRDSA